MSFKHPEFLYLLLAIIIPIIIHLFNFRRYKKLWFSNIQFLKNITTETRKQNKLKHLIVLLLRILAVVLIVLAFAGPEFRKEKVSLSSSSITAVYVDNSFSMMAEGYQGRLFEASVNQARDLARQLPRDKQFVLLTNKLSSGRRLLSKDAFLAELNSLSISPDNRKLSSVLRTMIKTREEKGFSGFEMYLLSDFQQNAFDSQDIPDDSLGLYYFLPQSLQQKRNIYLDSCWVSAPVLLKDRQIQLKIRLVNASEVDLDKIPLKVSVNGQQKAVAGVDIKANSSEVVSVNFTIYDDGWQTGIIEIEDYPIIFDDKLYFAFEVQSQIRILEINSAQGDQLLRSFYETESLFDFKAMDYRQVDYNQFPDFDLIILNGLPSFSSGLIGQVQNYIESGKNVFFVPGSISSLAQVNSFLGTLNAGRTLAVDTSRTRVIRINKESEMFREAINKVPQNADLPIVFAHYKYQYPISSELESLISLLNGDDFLLKKSLGQGFLYILASPLNLESSNFITNALFVPVMYNAAVQGKSINRLFYIIGEDDAIETDCASAPSTENPFVLKQTGSAYSIIPEQKVVNGKLQMDLHGGVKESGFYTLTINDNAYQTFAYNFNRQESQMDFLDDEALKKRLEASGLRYFEIVDIAGNNVTTVIKSLQKDNDLWKLFIILALLILLLEILILRFWN